MTHHVSVKPFIHWAIYRGYAVRYGDRAPHVVSGVLVTPHGEVAFQYRPDTRMIELDGKTITINEYGWEIAGEQ